MGVCVCAKYLKNRWMDLHATFWVGYGPRKNWLNFGDDPDSDMDPGIIWMFNINKIGRMYNAVQCMSEHS